MEFLYNLLEFLSSLAEEPIAAPLSIITPNVERLEAHRNTPCEKVGRPREHLLAHESKLVAELKNAEAIADDLEASFDASAAQVRPLEGELCGSKPLRLKMFGMPLVALLPISPFCSTLSSER